MPDKYIRQYSLSTCSHFRSIKKLLSDCVATHEAIDVDLLHGNEQKAVPEEVKRLNPRCSFPTILINDEIIVGFKGKKQKKCWRCNEMSLLPSGINFV